MDFEKLTNGERAALAGSIDRAGVALWNLRALLGGDDAKAREALLEYRKAHEAFERALTTISVRQRFAAQNGKEAAV